ncbi:MAG TPA: hypothetical protein VH210_05725 [Gaiellaceae bacterium]|jgi:hypothetical protein|nr:hypothetical protein [Gaiellaceae bacterium]
MVTRVSALVLFSVLLVACGSKKAQPPATATTSSSSPAATTTATTATTAGPGALQAEAAATGAGDIPDNQVFVVYSGKSFSMKFPEGWTQSGSGDSVTFRDKNNIVRIVIVPGSAPTAASVKQEIANLKGATAAGAPTTLKLNGLPAVKVTYRTTSAPNAVTGKRLTLTVDRYELAKKGKHVIVDLGSPVGVDNVDAYRMMIQSLRLK